MALQQLWLCESDHKNSPPCMKEVMAPKCSRMFIDTISWLHSLPKIIIFDWDPRFTNKFWMGLFELVGTNLWFSIDLHPHTYRQLERKILMLEISLRPYIERHPSWWARYLGLAEFAANNAGTMPTGYNLLYLNAKEHPFSHLNFWVWKAQAWWYQRKKWLIKWRQS